MAERGNDFWCSISMYELWQGLSHIPWGNLQVCLEKREICIHQRGILKEVLLNEVATERPLEYYDQGSDCYCANILSDGTSTENKATYSYHRPRTFITECNSKCACHFMCGNHVIQHGMMVKVQVRYGILSMD